MAKDLPKRILVVLGRSVWHEHVAGAPLLARAGELARLGCAELVMLDICHDDSLSYGPFASRAQIDTARSKILQNAASRLDVLAAEFLDTYGMEAGRVVRWDHDRCAAILEVAATEGADLIMKDRDDHDFVLGLFSNTDWDLLRQSPASVWFVTPGGGRTPRSGIIAAVDHVEAADDEERFQLDYRVFEQAQGLSRIYESALYVVHAYSVPTGLYGYQGYAPTLPGMHGPSAPAVAAQVEGWRREVAKRHGQAVQAFVDEFGIPLDDLTITEGPVDAALRLAVDSKGAGLIVMGASHKDRWARLLQRVSAEPTLADAECDVLFAKVDVDE